MDQRLYDMAVPLILQSQTPSTIFLILVKQTLIPLSSSDYVNNILIDKFVIFI